jgi:hypothetical protein
MLATHSQRPPTEHSSHQTADLADMDDFPIFLSKLIIMLDTSWITSLFIAIFLVSDILLACYGAHLYRRLKRQRLQMRDVPGET